MTQDFRSDIYGAMWACRQLSDRHRRWGHNAPTLDLDWMVIEYSRGVARALVDYKREYAALGEIKGSANLAAFRDIGTGRLRPLPVVVVRYQTEPHWAFEVHATNPVAVDLLGGQPRCRLTERSYVELIYRWRGVDRVDANILRNCDNEPPTMEAWPMGCLQ